MEQTLWPASILSASLFLSPLPELIDDSEGQQWNGMDMAVAKKK